LRMSTTLVIYSPLKCRLDPKVVALSGHHLVGLVAELAALDTAST
jgi:hypothetical protein